MSPYEPDSEYERKQTGLREADYWEDVHGYTKKNGKRVRRYTRFVETRVPVARSIRDLAREPELSPRTVAIIETAIRVPTMTAEERMRRARRMD